jgi:phosphoribosylformylglycinamidine synthase
MMKPKVLVPTGYGLNCEEETCYSYNSLGAEARKIHINDLLDNPKTIEDYHILALVGGFSDGDHLAAGRIHANRLRFRLEEPLREFIEDGKLVIGVCNGFQAMVKAGILPAIDSDYRTQTVTLTYNDSGKFEDRWVHIGVNPKSRCVWTKGIERLYLPIRHGEGKIRAIDTRTLERLESNNQNVLFYADPRTGRPTSEYPYNPNGSAKAIAGICDPTGRVFGMMPHWEAYRSPYNHPNWTRLEGNGGLPKEGMGLQVARNAIRYVQEKLMK